MEQNKHNVELEFCIQKRNTKCENGQKPDKQHFSPLDNFFKSFPFQYCQNISIVCYIV